MVVGENIIIIGGTDRYIEHRLDKNKKNGTDIYFEHILHKHKKVAQTEDKQASGLGKSPQTQTAAPARILGRL